jgi:hypothetical protein
VNKKFPFDVPEGKASLKILNIRTLRYNKYLFGGGGGSNLIK